MTFALFFGAGNMIFPPFIGNQAGDNIWLAVLGFCTTGVCLPLLGTVSGSLVDGKLERLGKKSGNIFYVVFPFIIYLCIGPLFIVPRAASVTYTMGIEPFVGNSFWVMPLFTGLYFLVSSYFAMNPNKMADAIGKFMTPALFIILAVIVIKSIVSPIGPVNIPVDEYATQPYFKGFVEGFLTMDTLGALVTANIVVSVLNGYGVTKKKDVVKYTSMAAIIAGIALILTYVGLSYIGSTATVFGNVDNGAVLLTLVMERLFGSYGVVILALVIALACLSTSIGVTSASSRFFHNKFPKVSYRGWVYIVTIVAFVVANLGLNTIIEITVPVLTIIYPEAIVVILLSFFYKYIKNMKYIYKVGVVVPLVISIVNTIDTLGIKVPLLTDIFSKLPLYDVTLGWIVPTVVAIIGTYLIEKSYSKNRI